MQSKLSFIAGIIALLFAGNGYGQERPVFNKLKEDSIRYKVFVAQPDEEKDEFFSRATVRITSLDSADWAEIRSLTNKDWIELLRNPQYDWGANLVLYQLYQKIAYSFKSIDTRQRWVERLREEDIKYWVARLK